MAEKRDRSRGKTTLVLNHLAVVQAIPVPKNFQKRSASERIDGLFRGQCDPIGLPTIEGHIELPVWPLVLLLYVFFAL